MKRQKVSKRDVVMGLLLLVALAVALSVAGKSDLESQQAITKEAALYHVVR